MPQPITYQQESLVTVMSEIDELARLEWEEVQHDTDEKCLEPDWELFLILEDRGYLKIFTARSCGKLVGYFFATINPDLHSKGNFFVGNDAIFLHPNYRKGRVGIKLFQFTEKCLAEDGYDRLYVTTTEKNKIDRLMSYMGYKKVETRFLKKIGKENAS